MPRHEPRHPAAGGALRVDLQPQLRGPPGQRRPHPPGKPGNGGGGGACRAFRRHPRVVSGPREGRLSAGRVLFSAHAVKRMFERGFTHQDVYRVADMGQAIEITLMTRPTLVVCFWAGLVARPVHMVLANDTLEGVPVVVTLYEPDDSQWQPDFRRRRL